jgi:PAS domain S-box-containing protein
MEKGLPNWDFTFRMRTKCGDYRWIHAKGRVVELDPGGNPKRAAGTHQDITGRVEAELTLKKSEARLSRLLRSLPSGIQECDTDGRITCSSPSYDRLMGFAPGESLGRKLTDFFHNEKEAEEFDALLQLLVNDQPPAEPYYSKNITNDGREIYVQVDWEYIRDEDGELTGFASIISDVTERKKSEDALRESEERFRQIAENLPEILWLITPDWKDFIYLSPAYERIWQRPAQELLEKKSSWLDSVYSEDLEMIRGEIEKARNSDDDEVVFSDYRIVCPDNSIRWVSSNAFKLRDENGETFRIIGLTEDITARRTLEEQLLQSQKMEAIGTLAGGIAHDFNNILAAVMGYTELAFERPTGAPEIKSDLAQIMKAANRAKGIVQQIVAFSRKNQNIREPLDLATIVEEVMTLLRASIPANVSIEIDLGQVQPIFADPSQMHQVVLNLATNAYQAITGDGTIKIKLETISSDDAAPAGEGKTCVQLSISDTGDGVPRELTDRIFEPYFTTKEIGAGSGLGLAVVHGIATSHGGTISFDSTVGEGTTFNVRLPVYEGEIVQGKAVQADKPAKGRERILFVDDEPTLATLGKELLGHYGYDVESFVDSEEALVYFLENMGDIDMVITDQTMPGITGDKLAEKILFVRPDMPILLCTGHGDLINEKGVDLTGIRKVLSKPVHGSQLPREVRKILDSSS